jgi:uracil-DNA glycosylase
MTVSRSLLLEIARCPNVGACLANPGAAHPCREVVAVQVGQVEHQLPEPWNGDIERAPILFVSSNPSIGLEEHYPDASWTDDAIAEFFENRFEHWMKDGLYGLHKDQKTRGRAVRFNSCVKRNAERILGRPPKAGRDYVFTEVVHCKSKQERGVSAATAECSRRYLGRVLGLSGAKVIVVLGDAARGAMAAHLARQIAIGVLDRAEVDARSRVLVALPHPNARKATRIDRVLAPKDLEQVREALR